MTEGALDGAGLRRLNHMEFVYRPGERDLVRALMDLLGFEKNEENGEFLIGFVDTTEPADNFLAGSEVRPEQWEFDQALAEVLRGEELRTVFSKYMDLVGREPQWAMHVGIRFESVEEWEATIARVAEVGDHSPTLAGRVRLRGVYRVGDPGAVSDVLHQAFVWTDVLASGSLAFGQQLELSTYAR
jgi:hypothetical protein